MDSRKTIRAFDSYLESIGLKFEATIIGGSALNVMAVLSRETIDVDCLSPKIPEEIKKAANEFRKLHPDLGLIEKWLNNGPESLERELESGWESRTLEIFKGKAITFKTLGRIDLLKTKLFAYCDREIDLEDCIAMKPTRQELDNCIGWVKARDMNPDWPKHVESRFKILDQRLKK